MTKFKVGDKVQRIKGTSNQLFEIIDFVVIMGMTCVIFKPLQGDNKFTLEVYEEFEANYKLCENDKPMTDLYVLLVDSFNGQAKQSFFADKQSAMFACMDIIKQSKNTARDLSICGDSVCVSSTAYHTYTLTLSHVNLTTGAHTYVDPNEIAVTYLYATNS